MASTLVVGSQVINKLLQTGDYNFIKVNGLDETYFHGFENEFNFINEHYKKYGKIPDTMTFLEKFQDFGLYEVNETDDYLLDRLYEENAYYKIRPVLNEANNKMKEDARLAYNYLKDTFESIKPHTVVKSKDIIDDAQERYEEYMNRNNSEIAMTISSGMPELDEVFGGWEFGEELVTIVARTNAGKSWIMLKFLAEAWKQGYRVGLYSGEMSPNKLGYRFDALFGHYSNRALVRGIQVDGYKDYIENLNNDNGACFKIATQKDFGGRPTVQHIRNFVEENKIQIMGIDQLSLMADGRASRNDPPRMRLSHIAEDLFLLSTEYKIPILALAQANRAGINKEDEMAAPGLESIKESDDIAHNSSKCIGMRQNNGNLILDIIKNREGRVGDKLLYNWDIDVGHFTYNSTNGDAASSPIKQVSQHMVQAAVEKATINNPF